MRKLKAVKQSLKRQDEMERKSDKLDENGDRNFFKLHHEV